MKRIYETPIIQCLDIGYSGTIAASGSVTDDDIDKEKSSSGMGVKIVNFASSESDCDFE